MSGVSVTLNLSDDAVREIVARVLAEIGERETEGVSPWMTVPCVAEYMAAPRSRIYKLTSTGELPHHKEGGRLLFHRDEVDAYIRGERVAGRSQGD